MIKRKILVTIVSLVTINMSAQNDLSPKARAIVEEGKLLYRSEMASWMGTELFIAKYTNSENIGGYFSYSQEDSTKCVFFSKAEEPTIIGTVSFESTFELTKAKTDLTGRVLSNAEYQLYEIRKRALAELQTNEDGLFKFYENTNPNIIPLINGKEKKVYILTGPQQGGVVIFGNDYLLTFDEENNLKSKKALHNNIIPIEYSNEEGAEVTIHSHAHETGDYITATDICTLMLYEKFTNWKSHNVVSENYLNMWNCETNELTVIAMGTLDKINADQKKRKKRTKK